MDRRLAANDVDLSQVIVDGPGGLDSRFQDADVARSDLEGRSARHLDGGPAGEDHKNLVDLDVGRYSSGVLPDPDGHVFGVDNGVDADLRIARNDLGDVQWVFESAMLAAGTT